MKRFLVTTAIKETLPSPEKSILFLGSWCFDYSRKKELEAFDYKFVEHPWSKEKEFFDAYLYLKKLYPNVLEAIVTKLNKIHCTTYSLKYWDILVGDWLKEYITILYERWMCIDSALSNYEISATALLPTSLDKFVPCTHSSSSEWRRTDLWNYLIYLEILKELDVDNGKIKYVRVNYTEEDLTYRRDASLDEIKTEVDSINLKEKLFSIFNRLLTKLSYNNPVFISRTWMGRMNEIKLSLKLKQAPVIYQDIKEFDLNDERICKRDWVFSFGDTQNDFESFLSRMITRFIPSIYLEKYNEFISKINSLGYPKSPKVICVASLQHDDYMKAYVAHNVENKAHLIWMQHGGGYGVLKMDMHEEFERRVADLYLTWGWASKKYQNVIPLGIQKAMPIKMKRKYYKSFDNKDILIIHHNFARYHIVFTGNHYAPYFSDQLSSPYTFLDNLNSNLLEHAVIKLTKRELGWYYALRYRDRYPSIKIEIGISKSVFDYYKHSKIVIHTYNGTGILETILLNVPCILLVDEICASVRDEAEDDFRNLKKIGVFHDNPLSASKFLNDIYSDVDTWWNSKDVQSVLNMFRKKYCNHDPDYLSKLAHLILERMKM